MKDNYYVSENSVTILWASFSFKAILAIKFTWKLCFDTWNEMFDIHQCTFVLFYFKNAKDKGKIQIIVFNVPQKTFKSFYNIHMTFYLTPKLAKQQQQF